MQIEGTYNIDYYRNLVADKVHCHDSLWFVGGAQWNAVQASSAKLAKMVSAIANSGGGELIFGIAQKRSRAEAFEPVKGFDKGEEWIFHEIQSQIDKPVDDLSVKICTIPDSDGKIIHIHIPANNNAPHQFTDNKFYRWSKGKCLVMNESEVRMAYMKISTCNLEFLGVTNINGIPT
ncbi:MAG: ATP-binding protein, partial [Bacteroidales bacterium]|nr:ATP-binding protein [Bacteroidales bacterium]